MGWRNTLNMMLSSVSNDKMKQINKILRKNVDFCESRLCDTPLSQFAFKTKNLVFSDRREEKGEGLVRQY